MTPILDSRSTVLLKLVGAGLLLTDSVQAQSGVDEADETAVALGYRRDTTQVNGKKYRSHKPDQKCNNCQGSATDAWAGCSMFGRKQIAAAGWCQAWK